MKKILILIITSILLYGVFRELNLIKVALIGLGLGASYLVCRIPARYIILMKYPVILIGFAITALFLVFPHAPVRYPADAFIVFIAFYSIAFYLITLKENEKGLYKETLAISILYFSALFNMFMIGKPVLIVPIGISIILFLFIIGHNRVIPFISAYTLFVIIAMAMKKTVIIGNGISFGSEVDRYLLLAAPLILFVVSFIGFVKQNNLLKIISFLGLLYVSIDILMVVGLRLSNGMLYQPLAALLIIVPLAGIMMKTEKERI